MGWQLPMMYQLTMDNYLVVQRMWGFYFNPFHLASKSFFVLPRPGKKAGYYFLALATNGEGWEHVSISIPTEKRCPTWEEMCYIKDLFWTKDCVVVQYHPAESEYVNQHSYCLHLWRPIGKEIPTPPKILIGL